MDRSFLPTTKEEARERGWHSLDVILITGDAYVDHPSFGVAVVGRYLESLGARVGVIATPDLISSNDFTRLGEPAWFFGITAGNLDSMIMRETAAKKHRSDDDYAPGGIAGKRPKRAVIAYCRKIRKLFPSAQVLIGGLEASLRRHAHYDYWDNRVRKSILIDSGADLLIFGMAEGPLREIIKLTRYGRRLRDIKDVSGTAALISKRERKEIGDRAVTLPSYEETARNPAKYARASKTIHLNQNPYSSKGLAQGHGSRYVFSNPPALPLSQRELDAVYGLPFTRTPHPCYKEKIPAWEMIRFSITAMRGCFGGCSFCALTVHQGRRIQGRSVGSVIREVRAVSRMEGFTGYVSDIGGPTANMYRMGCNDPGAEAACAKLSCLHPKICKRLKTDHAPLIALLREARSVKGIKKIFIGSGIRHDLANLSPDFIREAALHHVSGRLKVAPEHSHPGVLDIMKKPRIEEFERFKRAFARESRKAGLEQYLLPYFISAHPGCGVTEQIDMMEYLKKNGLRPRQTQDFIPAPMTLAADIYYTGIDPMTGAKVYVPRSQRERRLQKALMQYYKPENRDDVRRAKRMARGQTGRPDFFS